MSLIVSSTFSQARATLHQRESLVCFFLLGGKTEMAVKSREEPSKHEWYYWWEISGCWVGDEYHNWHYVHQYVDQGYGALGHHKQEITSNQMSSFIPESCRFNPSSCKLWFIPGSSLEVYQLHHVAPFFCAFQLQYLFYICTNNIISCIIYYIVQHCGKARNLHLAWLMSMWRPWGWVYWHLFISFSHRFSTFFEGHNKGLNLHQPTVFSKKTRIKKNVSPDFVLTWTAKKKHKKNTTRENSVNDTTWLGWKKPYNFRADPCGVFGRSL